MKKILIKLYIAAVPIGISVNVKAQIGFFKTSFFQNQYLMNPAQSGINSKQLNLSLGYLRESGSVSNGPKTMYTTAEYGLNEHVGLGINLVSDKFGPLATTKVMATYAYHLKLSSEGQKLSFGISAGGVQQKINEFDVVGGDLSDKSLYDFNQNKMQFETDFGVSYAYNNLSLQAAVPNIIFSLKNSNSNILNQATFFAAAAYKFEVDESASITIEPKVGYRSYKGIKNIGDLGANIAFLQNLNFFGIYHTNQNVTAGLGLKLLNTIQFSAAYSTQNSYLRQSSSGSNFEVGLRLFLSPNGQ
nr:PorP/SprF family type IX secretion system membrane protein [Pedobacter sp. ASV2]